MPGVSRESSVGFDDHVEEYLAGVLRPLLSSSVQQSSREIHVITFDAYYDDIQRLLSLHSFHLVSSCDILLLLSYQASYCIATIRG